MQERNDTETYANDSATSSPINTRLTQPRSGDVPLAGVSIRIERGKGGQARHLRIRGHGYGYFRPFVSTALDASRQIQAILGDPCHRQAGLFREGRDKPDMTCPVDVGARYRVAEDTKHGPRFRKFEPFDSSVFKAKEAVSP